MDFLQKTADIQLEALPALPIRTADVEMLPTPALPVETKSNNTLYYVLGALGLIALFGMSKKSKVLKKPPKNKSSIIN